MDEANILDRNVSKHVIVRHSIKQGTDIDLIDHNREEPTISTLGIIVNIDRETPAT